MISISKRYSKSLEQNLYILVRLLSQKRKRQLCYLTTGELNILMLYSHICDVKTSNQQDQRQSHQYANNFAMNLAKKLLNFVSISIAFPRFFLC